MGLAGPRKRQKISHDPNNTHWSSNTTTFGHKILASQGWTPGETLGPKNAAHAGHLTKASTSHVRVLLREDNLGLGAKSGSGQGPGECTGLGSFQDLLGRLNGKTEAVIQKERNGRANVNRMLYAERKYGGWSRFVSAGYLLGGESMQDQLDTTSTVDAHRMSRTSKDMTESTTTAVTQDDVLVQSPKKNKKKKETKRRSEVKNGDDEDLTTISTGDVLENTEQQLDDKAIRKEAKAQRRAEKAQRREARMKRKQGKTAQSSNADSVSVKTDITESADQKTTPISSNTASGSQTPTFTNGRQAVRSRYIMQKRAAMLDTKALNEILMVKV